MKIEEVKSIFDHFVDKHRDAGIESFEFCRYINTAQVNLMKESFFPKTGNQDPPHGFDMTEYDVERWKPCILSFEDFDLQRNLYTNSNGVLKVDDIKKYFPDDKIYDDTGLIDTKKPDILKIINASRYYNGQYFNCRWVRHNDVRVLGNPFKREDEEHPVLVIDDDRYRILPKAARRILLSVVRLPIHVWYDESDESTNIDPELPDATMMDVIIKATEYAGINIRERDLVAYMKTQK